MELLVEREGVQRSVTLVTREISEPDQFGNVVKRGVIGVRS